MVVRPPEGIVLVSPCSSVRDMATLEVSFPAAGWLVRNHYPTISRLPKVQVPVLVVHGDLDETVPIEQGRRLFEAANEPKTFQVLTGAAHNDNYIVAPEVLFGRWSCSVPVSFDGENGRAARRPRLTRSRSR